MAIATMSDLRDSLLKLDPRDAQYASRFVELLLANAQREGITDVHFQPTGDALEIRWRRDGVLQSIGRFPPGETSDIITRLKVLADLLTYRRDLPQEGRVRGRASGEQRISTFPTLHGERAVVRIFAESRQFQMLQDLGLTPDVETDWGAQLRETSGMLIVCGPAGSGKTTTLYASLREIASRSHITLPRDGSPQPTPLRSIVSLEDPVEVIVDGVAQAPIDSVAGFDFACAVRSVMRQDPEVIMIGEVRDQPTAMAAFTASLTGHLVLTTYHAGRAAEALGRLADMGIEPYMLRSGTRAILCQRLLRRLCHCKSPVDTADQFLELPLQRAWFATGCEVCGGTGYRGRMLLAELLAMSSGEFARQVLARADSHELEQHAREAGMVTCWERAVAMANDGQTSPEEVRRVLGFNTGASGISR